MTKKDLVNVVSGKMETTKKQTGEYVDMIFDTITDTIVSGEDVKITGFGTFSVIDRAERTCRNPQTGEQFIIPASKAPKFKASKGFKEAVNA